MSRIKRVCIALIAVVVVGAAGAGVANAGSAATLDFPRVLTSGNATCDVDLERSPWVGSSPTWSSEVYGNQVTAGGICDVNDVYLDGTLTKSSGGVASFDGYFSYEYQALPADCGYWASLTGSWAPDTSPPHDHKIFLLSGTAVRTSGGFLCPNTLPVSMQASVDY